MLVVWWSVWVPPRGHTTTTKEEERSIIVIGTAPRLRHDILIHGKPVVEWTLGYEIDASPADESVGS